MPCKTSKGFPNTRKTGQLKLFPNIQEGKEPIFLRQEVPWHEDEQEALGSCGSGGDCFRNAERS